MEDKIVYVLIKNLEDNSFHIWSEWQYDVYIKSVEEVGACPSVSHIVSFDENTKQLVSSELLKEKDEQIMELKKILKFAGVPELIIENPKFIYGGEPSEKDIEWAKSILQKQNAVTKQ